MTTYRTEWGAVHRADGCKDDYSNLETYDVPPYGVGLIITLQRSAMRSFQKAEERYARKVWRPGWPRKVEARIDRDIWSGEWARDEKTRIFRPIFLTGSIRSCDLQEALYRRDPQRYAPPSKGVHMHGLAIDVHTGYLNETIRRILSNLGWRQSRPDDEPWHFSYYVMA